MTKQAEVLSELIWPLYKIKQFVNFIITIPTKSMKKCNFEEKKNPCARRNLCVNCNSTSTPFLLANYKTRFTLQSDDQKFLNTLIEAVFLIRRAFYCLSVCYVVEI